MIAEMLSFDFMRNALMGGLMVCVLCSLLSFFVVLKRLSFIGVGISHSAFGGLAIGVLLGFNPFICAGIFSVLVAWGIGITSQKGKLHEDTTIGIFFSAAMALGVALISLSREYKADLFSLLFGNILAITQADLWMVAICGVGVALFLFLFFKELLAISFDDEVARVGGLPVDFLYYGLLTAMAITVVASIKVVGIILVEALLVIPAATGFQMSKNYRWMLFFSLASGALSLFSGLILSYWLDIASGATIVLCASLLFVLAFLFSPGKGVLLRGRG
ncbi:MAG: metal ABC transporter permease [Geobacter sp.]|nr:metal ABC transporter permease [Geobacter sp.]